MFAGHDKSETDQIIDYLHHVQFIQLDAKGTIRLSEMKDLVRALKGEMIYLGSFDFKGKEDDEYIYEAGMPEQVYDNAAENRFFRVHVSDLAPSTVFPFALDNQWLPDQVIARDTEMRGQFLKYGFRSKEVQEYLHSYQRDNLCLSLIHNRQIILNRAFALNSQSLHGLYFEGEEEQAEKRAFRDLLKNGSIIIFLYGDNEITPYVSRTPKYATIPGAVEQWNKLCTQIPMYCIRENWETPVDTHRQAFAKQCTTLASNPETNEMLAKCFGFGDVEKNEFLTVLKEIEMTVFLQTHILGTGHRFAVEGYSRTAFLKNFIVKEPTEEIPDPDLDCIMDPEKPFHEELKKLIDVFYNSNFANFFDCAALVPGDIRPEDTFIYQLYLKHGRKEVGPDELEYAFSEFFKNETILKQIGEMGGDFYLENWSLERIAAYRNTMKWREYIELAEYIAGRSTNWEVDFSSVESLVQIFVESIKSCSPESEKRACESLTPAYTFRICIGSRVLDIVCTEKTKKLKVYPGIFLENDQNSLTIQFMIGDSTSEKARASDSVFLPIKIFDGKTNFMGGNAYFDDITGFLIGQCGFMRIY